MLKECSLDVGLDSSGGLLGALVIAQPVEFQITMLNRIAEKFMWSFAVEREEGEGTLFSGVVQQKLCARQP